MRTAPCLLVALLAAALLPAAETKLWYEKPATNWLTEALPVGNGTVGAMVFGQTDRERITFNESSLWTGTEADTGSYQPFGEVLLELGHRKPQDYRRELDLQRGVQTVTYTHEGVRYRREIFASHPAGAIVIRLTADRPGAYTGKVWLTDAHGADVLADGPRLTATGVLNNGLDYEAQLLALPEGGKVTPVLAPGFANQPVPRVRPEVPVLDGRKDVYLSLRGSDKPFFEYYNRRTNDDATPTGQPLVIDGAWFDRGISFQAPNEFSFPLGGHYRWLTFHARVVAGVTLQVWLDGQLVREVSADPRGQYVAIPVAGAAKLTLKGTSTEDPKSKQRLDVLLGHLRVSPAAAEPAKDSGVAGRWQSLPGSDALIPPAALAFERCDSLTFILGAGTSYLADHARGWRGAHPHAGVTARVAAAARQTFAALLAAHEEDHRRLFDRVKLDLGSTPPEVTKLPTDRRLLRYGAGEADPDFEQLAFQVGRYLLIASSRAGGLPANLQGIWNISTSPPWRGDYHSNIDLQMCYWPAEPAGLAEWHVPLLDFITAQAPVYRKNMLRDPEMVKRFPGHRGWTIRTETGVFGASSWELNTPANAWYCHHLWQHFEFGQDRAYLRRQAYPVMKEVCEFWIDHLVTLPDGRLATPDGWSAEWGPREPAVTYDQELIWDLFNNTVAAADVLGVDADFRARLATMRDKLVTPSIGRHGQLKEWFDDKDDMDSRYRHVSHLWALYPGRQITLRGTPEWAAAARISLLTRGDDAKGKDAPNGPVAFSLAWKACFWARLQEAERAYGLVRLLVRPAQGAESFVGANLLNRLLQLEGEFGHTAAIAEMLVQSHGGEIHLLPALPAAWPTGRVTGLRARGGVTVDVDWEQGRVTRYRLTAREPAEIKVRVNGQVVSAQAEKL